MSDSKPSTKSTAMPCAGRLLHGDDATVADRVQRLGDHRADRVVVVLPRDQAIERIKAAIAEDVPRRGEEIVTNERAVDGALAGLHRIDVPRGPPPAAGFPRSFRPLHPPSYAK